MLLDLMKNRKRIIAVSLSAFVLILLIYLILLLGRNTFYKGIYIEGLNVSGLSREEAAELVNERIRNSYLSNSITLSCRGGIWNYGFEDISLRFLTEESVENAYKVGHTGNIFKRLAAIFAARFKHYNTDVEVVFDKAKINKILYGIKQQIDKSSKNATVLYKNGTITFKEEEIGQILDVDSSVLMLENQIIKRNFSEVELPVKEVVPKIRYKDIDEIGHVLSSFTTGFNPSAENRTHNLSISCGKIDGTVLMPGEIFSMNLALGPRTAENGYKEAKVIFKNEYIDGIGGGVCQVTTTLYDAVLLAMLDVLERTPHSLTPLYVSPGQDATIADDYIDFKFQNSRDYPICISAGIKNGEITFRILGKNDPEEKKVILRPSITNETPPEKAEFVIDDSIPDNEKVMTREPKNGCRVILYREVYDSSGKLVKKEKISEDTYKPVTAQYKVNKNYVTNTINEEVIDNG